MKELAIGEETIIRIKCVEDGNKVGCQSCALINNAMGLCREIECSKYNRTDGKYVHFEIVED